jgi:Zn-dependent protease with chaperone function
MVSALYFDGQSARQQQVELQAAAGLIAVRGESVQRDEPLSGVRVSSKLGHAPRRIYFSDGAHCAITDHGGFEALLKDAGMRPLSLLARMEANWRHALAATVLFVLFIAGSFVWGLPWAAEIAAKRVPPRLASTLDTQFLKSLDGEMLLPSKLSSNRQKELTKRFEHLRISGGLPPHSLLFRNSPSIGANAFALPGGTIVLTDQLAHLAANDEEILAVLAHELGHVVERHPMRQLLQSSVVGLAMTWYFGDISSLLTAAPTLLLETSYSRDFERRADRFAAATLRTNGIASTRLADILEKLESAHHVAAKSGKGKIGVGQQQDSEDSSGIFRYFSTHPETAERIRELRSEAAQ